MRPCFCTCCFTVFVFCCFTFWFTINCHLRLEVIFRMGAGPKIPLISPIIILGPAKVISTIQPIIWNPAKFLTTARIVLLANDSKLLVRVKEGRDLIILSLLDKLQVSLILWSGGFLLIESPQCLSWSPPRPTIFTNMFGNIRIGGSRRDIIHD